MSNLQITVDDSFEVAVLQRLQKFPHQDLGVVFAVLFPVDNAVEKFAPAHNLHDL